MSYLEPSFSPQLGAFDLDTLERHEASVLGLLPDLTISYVNPAFRRFAEENYGRTILEDWSLGAGFLDAIGGSLRGFYESTMSACLRDEQVWTQEYECSSAELYRRFRMDVYPLARRAGLLCVHSLLIEEPHAPGPVRFDLGDYLEEGELVRQCMHCRRIRRLDAGDRWDWLPRLVANPHPNTSHGLCPICSDFYFPAVDDESDEDSSSA